ncbi:hypothetical protein [Bradyrhizobium sp. NBAIM01]|uniref:hypothetical protein n=1 Tax=Bradyrhizobium sp. NBAIM01 TaxID=2793818 RepID=UPI003207C8D7|nr:hypothetical protein [Bradyrhizobium sp. NBAIM01]
MPARVASSDSLEFEGNKLFFEQALDRAALIVRGRNSHEQQPNSPTRCQLPYSSLKQRKKLTGRSSPHNEHNY